MKQSGISSLFLRGLLRLLPGVLCVAGAHGATVSDFGAVGDGVADDTAAIQRAINLTASGGSVVFPAGLYRITSPVKLKSGISYQGVNNPVLLESAPSRSNGFALLDGSEVSNVSVSGIIFDGGGISLAQLGWTNDNVAITGNTFRNLSGTGNDNILANCGIFVDNVNDVTISSNSFTDLFDTSSVAGIIVYHSNHIAIIGNTFDHVRQGISVSSVKDPADLTDIRIQNNRFTRIYRMAIEVQTGSPGHPVTGLVIDGNVGYNWSNAYPDSFGISLASYSQNAQITNNFWDASPTPANSRFGYCLEVDGNDTLVQGNTCVASNNPVGWAFAGTSVVISGQNALVRNNTICGSSKALTIETAWATFQSSGNAFPPCGQVLSPPAVAIGPQ